MKRKYTMMYLDPTRGFDTENAAIDEAKTRVSTSNMKYGIWKLIKIVSPVPKPVKITSVR